MNIGRKYKTATVNNKPSLTDQSQAAETDVNVIVKRYAVTGTVPGHPQARNPLYNDWTMLPGDLREYIDTARSLHTHRQNLPPELKQLTDNELQTLPWNALVDKIRKPAEQPAVPQEPKQ